MPKILYIEDELTQNIATIRKFFAPILRSKSIQRALQELENSERIFSEDIVDACKPNSELDIAFTFPAALDLIIKNHKSYDLVIVDRNLSSYDYANEVERMLETLNELGLDFDEERILEFHEREGDLLLQLLLKLDLAYKNKVFYLTANTSDALRGSPQLQTLIDVDSFRKEQIIEKGSSREDLINAILSNMQAFQIQNKYREQCTILRKHLDEEMVNQFIKMVKYYNKNNRPEFVSDLRNLLENLLNKIAFSLGEYNADYWNEYERKKVLQIKPFILHGLKKYNQNNHIGYNSIIKNACISIYEISSDAGVHSISTSIDANSINTSSLTVYTLETLLNQICDVILWFGAYSDKV